MQFAVAAVLLCICETDGLILSERTKVTDCETKTEESDGWMDKGSWWRSGGVEIRKTRTTTTILDESSPGGSVPREPEDSGVVM